MSLDGLNFSVYANWPGAIHEGNGEAVVLIDERASDRQRDTIATLVGGTVGGPWGVLAWTWSTKVHGPRLVSYDIQLNGIGSRVKAGNVIELESTVIKNPVSGKDAHPRVILPEGTPAVPEYYDRERYWPPESLERRRAILEATSG